jgi:hypothetical protein
METYIMIVMLCHIAPNGQEVCIPMTPSPQIYYKSKQSCNDASIIKREEMKKVAEQNNIIVTGVFSDCIKSEGRSSMRITLQPIFTSSFILFKDLGLDNDQIIKELKELSYKKINNLDKKCESSTSIKILNEIKGWSKIKRKN